MIRVNIEKVGGRWFADGWIGGGWKNLGSDLNRDVVVQMGADFVRDMHARGFK